VLLHPSPPHLAKAQHIINECLADLHDALGSNYYLAIKVYLLIAGPLLLLSQSSLVLFNTMVRVGPFVAAALMRDFDWTMPALKV
jgi:hypothetical protein